MSIFSVRVRDRDRPVFFRVRSELGSVTDTDTVTDTHGQKKIF